MDKIIISGGKQLSGDVVISGSKNSALPILVSTLLAPGKCKLKNIPNLRDIDSILSLLNFIGAESTFEKSEVNILR